MNKKRLRLSVQSPPVHLPSLTSEDCGSVEALCSKNPVEMNGIVNGMKVFHLSWGTGESQLTIHIIKQGEKAYALVKDLRVNCPKTKHRLGHDRQDTYYLKSLSVFNRVPSVGIKVVTVQYALELMGLDYLPASYALEDLTRLPPCNCSEKSDDDSSTNGVFEPKPFADNTYEVESILDMRETKDGKREYKIKWCGYAKEKDMTWEPEDYLTGCNALLIQFHFQYLKKNKLQNQYELTIPVNHNHGSKLGILRDASRFMKAMTRNFDNPPEPPISVRNDYDNEGFKVVEYLQKCVGAGFSQDGDPVFYCECKGNCAEGTTECCRNPYLDEPQACPYDKNKKVVAPVGTAIFECNKSCKCDKRCPKRVVQLGRKVKLSVCRTPHKGWGVVTSNFIEKEYVGEIIKHDEVKARERRYKLKDRTYFFDLDFHKPEDFIQAQDKPVQYTLDAYPKGNIARDPSLPHIAFFAACDIEAGEELTFNYRGNEFDNTAVKVHKKTLKSKGIAICHCGTSKCKGYICRPE